MRSFKRIETIEDLCHEEGRYVLSLNGVDIHFNFKPSTQSDTDTLLIGFHGSVNRETRSVPAFISFLPGIEQVTHQLCIADPSLRTADDISMAWYAGDSTFEAQKIFPSLFSEISRALGVKKTIFFGTSGGGFAALYYSFFHEGSLAIVGNPQTSIGRYYERHIEKYVTTCWPSLNSFDELGNLRSTDLLKVYDSGPMQNSIVYLQNSTDEFHVFGHMAPFFASIKRGLSRKRIVSECYYPGSFGHNPVWEMFSPWVRAAVAAPDWNAEEIIKTHFSITQSENGEIDAITSGVKPEKPSSNHSRADLLRADLLRNYHLQKRQVR